MRLYRTNLIPVTGLPALAARFFLVALAGCSTLPGSSTGAIDTPVALELGAGKDAEVCFRLAANERIEYQFKATVALDFNLHSHRAGVVFMPVDIKLSRTQSGFYAAPQAEDYCMMWSNASAVPAHVTGQWRRLR